MEEQIKQEKLENITTTTTSSDKSPQKSPPTPDNHNEDDDPELDELLDSALEDMSPEEIRRRRREHRGGSNISGIGDGVEWNPSEHVWSQEFLQQAAATFDSNMAALLNSVKGSADDSAKMEQLAATFQMVAEAASQVMRPGAGPIDKSGKKSFSDVSAAIAKTMEKMNADSDNLQNTFSDDELTKLFAGLNMDNPQDPTGSTMFVPFMQGIMQSLLSKEVLYPSIKDIVDKYPTWLKDNQNKLDKKDYDRYSRQNILMKRVCEELETEKETDGEETKKNRFDKVLELMQQMQELGEPPAEIAGEMGDIHPTPDMSKIDPSQCKAM